MSVTSAGGTRRAGSKGSEADFAGAPSTLVHELTRLRNELKVKDGAIEVRAQGGGPDGSRKGAWS